MLGLDIVCVVYVCVVYVCARALMKLQSRSRRQSKKKASTESRSPVARSAMVWWRLVSFVIDFKGTPPSRPRNSRHSNRDASGSQEGREGGQQEGRGGTWRDYLQVRGVAHVHGHGANQEPVEDILRDVVRVSFSALGPSAAPSAHCSSVLSTRKEPTLREGVESKQVIHEATGATGGNQI